jgi:hypothetical protein
MPQAQPEAPPPRPYATDSGEEEMPDEEAVEESLRPTQQSTPTTLRRSSRLAKMTQPLSRIFRPDSGTGEEHEASHVAYNSLIDEPFDAAYIAESEMLLEAAINEEQDDPKTLKEARSRPDWPKWQEAMDREIATLEEAGTWITVPKPPNKNIVGSKWVFRIKRKSDGSIEKYKARLVARGFTQKFGIDYFDTFSPVARLASFRTILAIAARKDWDIDTFDFNGAYLNGQLNEDEDIYMQPPPGYDAQGETVKHLKKSLYGLKQAGRKWYDTLMRALLDLGFRVNNADPGVFSLHLNNDIIILAIHVDDCMITGSSGRLITEYKKKLHSRYSLTDLGRIHWLLGIKITRDPSHYPKRLILIRSYLDSPLPMQSLFQLR